MPRKPSFFKIWFMAIRPKTLWASVCPVAIGVALAWSDNVFHLEAAVATLLCAMFLQIGTNFSNDYCDFVNGADTADRIGPKRVTQAGLVPPSTMRFATVLAFGVSAFCILYLFYRAGWPLAVLGAVSILCGVMYTAGPFPLAYKGLGDVFVLVFFGPVAVAGTYYVQSLQFESHTLVAGIAPGLLSTAILAVNNLRDVEQDARVRKKTLAVRFGRTFVRLEYLACILGASSVPVYLAWRFPERKMVLLAGTILLVAIPLVLNVFRRTDGPVLNRTLAGTAVLGLLYAILFCTGWLI